MKIFILKKFGAIYGKPNEENIAQTHIELLPGHQTTEYFIVIVLLNALR
jgi:hypothetical protein